MITNYLQAISFLLASACHPVSLCLWRIELLSRLSGTSMWTHMGLVT